MASNRKANAALASAMILLLVCSVAAYFAFANLRMSQEWIQHTREVQSAIDLYGKTITRASRLRAEYVDSGDESSLQRHSEALVQARNAMSLIQSLTTDNSNQRASWQKLVEVTRQRVALMEAAIQLKRSGESTLEKQAPITRELISTADATDQLLQLMYNEEEGLLAKRQLRERRVFSATVAILATSLFLALVLFLIHHQLLTDQVRERGRAEAAQRALSVRLLTLQDEERRRFARELHDSVGQHLAALKMAISIQQSKSPSDATLQDCVGLLDEAIAETRTISHLLHPPLLDEAGLNSASRWFVEGFGKRSGIDVQLDIKDGGARLSEPIELVLFRVLQESLTNVHRHSGATRATVGLSMDGSTAVLRVTDNGHGVPVNMLEKIRDDGAGAGVGLAGMTERIREIGGQLEINSNEAGTEIVARVPARYRSQRQGVSQSQTHEVAR